MNTNYNPFFETFIGNNNFNKEDLPIIGLLAYVLYKVDKKEFITKYKSEHSGEIPSQDIIENYCKNLYTTNHIHRYKEQAMLILNKWMNIQFQKQIEFVEGESIKACMQKNEACLKKVIEDMGPKYESYLSQTIKRNNSVLRNLLLNFLGTLIYWLIIVIILMGFIISKGKTLSIGLDGININ